MRTTRPPPPPPPPSNTRFGHYTLLNRIAVGGMAEVFRAHATQVAGEPREVVIKRLLPALGTQAEGRAMFVEEARIGRRVRHPNVVEVLDHGEEAGQPFLTLEFVKGVDLWRLTRWLTRTGRKASVPLVMFIVREMLAGLHAVHEALDEQGEPLGVVHRDVSPSNILLSVHGQVKLGDFGIARALARRVFPHAAGQTKGKLGYLAPEQVSGLDFDRRSDIFAAAVIAAELLMGRPLFAGGSELAVLLAIRDGQVHPFLEFMPVLPEPLGAALVTALAQDPNARTPTAAALRDQLEAFQMQPEAELRRELSDLIREVLAESEPGSGSKDHTPVMAGVHDEPTPIAHMDALRERSAARTAEFPMLQYQVRTEAGDLLGPWPYAQVVEAVATGRLGAHDRVSLSGGAFRPMIEINELARHLPPSTTSAATPTTRKRSAPASPDKTFAFLNGGFISALGQCLVLRDTGLLLCESGGARKEVYIKDGMPEFVTSNLAGELLGEHLVKRGVISRGELDMALAVMPRFEGRLGDTLAALGLVEPVQLFQHIADQVREKLLDLFVWSTGTAALYRGVPPPQSGFPLRLDPWQILEEGIHRRFDNGLEGERFQGKENHIVVRKDPVPEVVRSAMLPEDARLVLTLLEAPRSVAQLTEALAGPQGKDAERPLRALVLLLHLGAIDWRDTI